ncbi:hypothetical protein MJO28_003156, partial [Puccinia striiformis f. sp. tritici]
GKHDRRTNNQQNCSGDGPGQLFNHIATPFGISVTSYCSHLRWALIWYTTSIPLCLQGPALVRRGSPSINGLESSDTLSDNEVPEKKAAKFEAVNLTKMNISPKIEKEPFQIK